MGKRIIVIGSSFAGLTAAIELRDRLGDDHEVMVLSRASSFLFMPSLIWVPFGLRHKQDITFPLAPIYASKKIPFKQTCVERIDLADRQVETPEGRYAYDYLVIATGPKLDYAAVPGLGPQEFTQSIFTMADADRARLAYEEFLEDPGPIVIGAVQGASCFGAAYEFLLNMAHQLRKTKLADRVSLTYITAEPYLGHFGLGHFGVAQKMCEMFFEKLGIGGVTNATVKEFTKNEVRLTDGRTWPFKYAMFAPPFLGVDSVRACTDIVDERGFVKVNGCYQTLEYPEVFAAGVAVSMPPRQPTKVPCGVPKTGYLSEEMARIVAHNIVVSIKGGSMLALPPAELDAKCVLDAGNTGIIMTADHFLEPRQHAWLIPGPEAHWAKVAFEKYFLAMRRHGHVA